MARLPPDYNYVTRDEVKDIVDIKLINSKVSMTDTEIKNIINDKIKTFIDEQTDSLVDKYKVMINDIVNKYDVGIYIKENNLIDSSKINTIVNTEIKNKINAIFIEAENNELIMKILSKELSGYDFTKHIDLYLKENKHNDKYYLELLDCIFWFSLENRLYVVENTKVNKDTMTQLSYVGCVYNKSKNNPRSIKLISNNKDESPRLQVDTIVQANIMSEIASLYFNNINNKMIVLGYQYTVPFTLYFQFKINKDKLRQDILSGGIMLTTDANNEINIRIENVKILEHKYIINKWYWLIISINSNFETKIYFTTNPTSTMSSDKILGISESNAIHTFSKISFNTITLTGNDIFIKTISVFGSVHDVNTINKIII